MVQRPKIQIRPSTSCSMLYRINRGRLIKWTIMRHAILQMLLMSQISSYDSQVTFHIPNVLPDNDQCLMSALKKTIPPIIHYSGDEPFTKYEICLVFAKILGLPHRHIVPDSEAPIGNTVTRPRDCCLYTRETEDLDVERGLGLSLFEEWWTGYLKQ